MPPTPTSPTPSTPSTHIAIPRCPTCQSMATPVRPAKFNPPIQSAPYPPYPRPPTSPIPSTPTPTPRCPTCRSMATPVPPAYPWPSMRQSGGAASKTGTCWRWLALERGSHGREPSCAGGRMSTTSEQCMVLDDVYFCRMPIVFWAGLPGPMPRSKRVGSRLILGPLRQNFGLDFC